MKLGGKHYSLLRSPNVPQASLYPIYHPGKSLVLLLFDQQLIRGKLLVWVSYPRCFRDCVLETLEGP